MNKGADIAEIQKNQPPVPFDIIPKSNFRNKDKMIKAEADLFYDLLKIDEQEKVIMYKFVAVRPVAIVGTSMGTVGRIAPID